MLKPSTCIFSTKQSENFSFSLNKCHLRSKRRKLIVPCYKSGYFYDFKTALPHPFPSLTQGFLFGLIFVKMKPWKHLKVAFPNGEFVRLSNNNFRLSKLSLQVWRKKTKTNVSWKETLSDSWALENPFLCILGLGNPVLCILGLGNPGYLLVDLYLASRRENWFTTQQDH